MDDETAEIELLEQNLQKTRQISKRMTSILNSFDSRLIKLEKSILPLYTSTQVLNRRASNIEKALLKIDEVASNQEGVAVEEALILRGPQPDQLDTYKDALERLNASIAFKSSSSDTLETARLVETGAKKLAQLYTKLIAEASVGASPSPSFSSSVRPLVAFLRTLPLPSTHPNHPAAAAIFNTLKEAQRGYADMRGKACRKYLEEQGKRVLEKVERASGDEPDGGVGIGTTFGKWAEEFLNKTEDECALLNELSPISSPSSSSYSTLLNPLMVLFSANLTSLLAFIKRSLQQYTFLALSAYEYLISLSSRFDAVLSFRDSSSSKNEFREGLTQLRSVVLRSFPTVLGEIKYAAMGAPGKGTDTMGTGLADIVVSTVRFLERIPGVQSAAGAVLVAIGDGNWKMGEGMPSANAEKKRLGEGDEITLLEHFVFDVVVTTISTLNALANSPKRPPAMNAIFLLNNVGYLRRNVLLEPKHDALIDLLSKPTQDTLNSNYRTAKAGYFEANFMALTQVLGDERMKPKDRFTRFYDVLEEILDRHRIAKVVEGKGEIGEEVVKLVVPSLQRFTAKVKEKEFSKNLQKYIKMPPDEVERQLRSLY